MTNLTGSLRTRCALAAGLTVTAAMAAATLAPPARAATFSPPQQLGASSSDPHRAIEGRLFADGSAAVNYGYYSPQLVLRAPGQPFGAPQPLGRDSQSIAVAPRDGATIAYDTAARHTMVVDVGPGATLGLPIDAGRGVPGVPVVNARGDAVVPVYRSGYTLLRLMLLPHGRSRFHAPLRLDDRYDVEIVPLRNGFAVAWSSLEECAMPRPALAPNCSRIVVHAAVSRDGSAFGPVQTLGPAAGAQQHGRGIELRLLPLARDGALVAWSGHGRGARTRVATLSPSGRRFGRAHVVSRPGRTGRGVEAAANRRGDALVAWLERGRDGFSELRLAARGRDGRWERSRRMSSAATVARSPRLRLNDRGDALLAWSSGVRWWVRTRVRDSRFTAAAAMPESPRPWLAQLSLDRAGTVLALFRREQPDAGRKPAGSVEGGVWRVGTEPRTQTLADTAFGYPALAANAGGTALATWTSADGLVATVRQPRHGFDPPVTVSTRMVAEPQPHINDRGDLLILSYGSGSDEGSDDYPIGAVLGTAKP